MKAKEVKPRAGEICNITEVHSSSKAAACLRLGWASLRHYGLLQWYTVGQQSSLAEHDLRVLVYTKSEREPALSPCDKEG